MAEDNIPIIDAHIHLYPESEVSTLAWCKPGDVLYRQQSVDEYKAATTSAPPKGFIFVEADRKSDAAVEGEVEEEESTGWTAPVQEVSFLKRIVTGQPRDGEGHGPDDKDLCKAIVPWAPLPAGPEALEKYLDRVKEEAGQSWDKVKGFRYLVQDKAAGTMLQDGFIESLKVLGRRGFVFELGVDQHRRGRAQLEEVVAMIDLAHEGVVEEEDKVVIIINHMCKPDLEVYNTHTDTSFIAWRTAMFALSKCRQVYMKLSGGFAEMPESLRQRPAEQIFEALTPWLTILIAAFGPGRLMFASDWPICTVGVGDDAWDKWRKIVERLCWMASFDEEQKRMIWGGTALKAYGIES